MQLGQRVRRQRYALRGVHDCKTLGVPPPKGWADMPARVAGAEITDPVVIAAKVTPAIAETVKKQIETGIDCIGDGEFLDGAQSRPLRRPLHRCRGAHRRAECRKAISRPSSGSSRTLSMKQRAAIPMLWPPALANAQPGEGGLHSVSDPGAFAD